MTNSNSGKEKPNITLIVMCIVWCLVFLVFIGLFYNYMRTARAKSRFNNDVLKVSDLSELGFINPYKDHHNKGTAYYEEGDMESAEEEFRNAFNILAFNGSVSVKEMTEYLGCSDKTVYSRISKMKDEFVLSKGRIYPCIAVN